VEVEVVEDITTDPLVGTRTSSGLNEAGKTLETSTRTADTQLQPTAAQSEAVPLVRSSSWMGSAGRY